MKPTCTITGCDRPRATKYTPYCARHKANHRRNGHAEQQRTSKAMLKPYLRTVRARIKRNPSNPAWEALDKRWLALLRHSEGISASYARGVPGFRYEVLAAREVIKTASADTRLIVETTMAMMVFREFEPHQFKSDRAFWIQLSRQVRSLTDLSYCTRFRPSSGRIQRVYRELPPTAALTMGRWLTELLGVGGLKIAQLEMAEQERRAGERTALHAALNELA